MPACANSGAISRWNAYQQDIMRDLCQAAIGLVCELGGGRLLSIHEQQLQCLHDFGTIA